MRVIIAISTALLLVASAAKGQQATGESVSIWDGVYSDAQALRGQFTYEGACSYCHGSRLDGAADDPDQRASPPLARAKFLRDWDGRSLAVLFEMSKSTMPADNPGSLSDEEYAEIIAYMLSVSRIPAGDNELPSDTQSLAGILIKQE